MRIFYNIAGERIKRSPHEFPYSYDPFVLFKDGSWSEFDEAVYSDRLYEWDSELYDRCCETIWRDHGQYFSRRKPTDIERFLRLYFKKNLRLTGIEEGCNVRNGYPYWIFYMKKEGNHG